MVSKSLIEIEKNNGLTALAYYQWLCVHSLLHLRCVLVCPGGGWTPEGDTSSVPNPGEKVQQSQETHQRVPAEVRRDGLRVGRGHCTHTHTQTHTLTHSVVFLPVREIEYLKKETAQRRAQEESEASHKEEADTLQEKVSEDASHYFCSSSFTLVLGSSTLLSFLSLFKTLVTWNGVHEMGVRSFRCWSVSSRPVKLRRRCPLRTVMFFF